jgi:hypothetical protein
MPEILACFSDSHTVQERDIAPIFRTLLGCLWRIVRVCSDLDWLPSSQSFAFSCASFAAMNARMSSDMLFLLEMAKEMASEFDSLRTICLVQR